MKVLVTGATGFVGRYVVGEFLKMGWQVVASSTNAVKAREHDWFERVEYVECDLNVRRGDYFDFFGRPDLLIHLAWEGLPNYGELFHLEQNLFSSYMFCKNMVEGGLRSLAAAGTCLEYGLREGEAEEEMATHPVNCYGLAKDTLRRFLEELNKQVDFEFKWIRLFYMYGEGQNPNSLLRQLESALARGEKVFNMSGGEQVRDYLPVQRVAEYIVRAAIQDEVSGIINCCSGEGIAVRQLVEDYLAGKHKSIELNPGHYPYPDYEPMAFWGSNRKLRRALKCGGRLLEQVAGEF